MTTHIPKWRFWLAAIRPKTLTVAFVAVLAGTALAFSVGGINWLIALLTLVCSLLTQTGSNLINDAADFKTGADTGERVGFPRASQMGWLTYKEVHTGGLTAFALAFLLAMPLVFYGGAVILVLLILSILAGYGYTEGPYPLAYHGLGDLFVLLFFGYVCTGIPYYLQTGVVDLKILLAATQIGVLSTLLIAINNTRDIEGDEKAGKKTLAVRYGIRFGKMEISLTLLIPFLLNLLWVKLGYAIAAFLPLSLLPLATIIVQGIWKHNPGRLYNGYFVLSALLHLTFGLLLSLGFVLQVL